MDQSDALFYTKKNPSLTPITRCCPDHVIKALATLGFKDQSEVERYRLGAFLSSTLKSPGKRDLIWWLLDNSTLEKDSIIMHIKPGADLRITPWVVHKVPGLPVDTGVIPAAFGTKERNKE